jgi:hypothetical protein
MAREANPHYVFAMKMLLPLLLVSCGLLSLAPAADQPAPEATQSPASETPVQFGGLTFERTLFKQTAKHGDTEVTADFKFKVTGDKTVNIKDVATYCSCLKAKTKDGKTEFKPGEEGIVETAFLLGTFEGEVTKQVEVVTDDPNHKEITLGVKVTIPPLYKVEPEHLIWTVGDEAKAKTMKFTVLGDKEINVTGLVSSRENMVAELKEIKKGREYEIKLTPKTTEEPVLGVLRVETNAPFTRYQKRLLFFSITRQKVDPVPAQ